MKAVIRLHGAAALALLIGASLATGGARADQVFNDDVIITGSLCVGFDCTANMNFGSDTIVLRENNLRIFFDDTSTTSGFPANDWRLIANDSVNGGSNFFAIEDATAARQVFKVTAGARLNSIFVSSTGNVGFGTATPVLVMHALTGNTPGLRLEQDGSQGWPPYIWDIAGNEANFFIRDVTAGSRLPFRIRPGAPTSSIDIAATGNVGIGTASPLGKLHLHITTTPGPEIRFTNTVTGTTATDGGFLGLDVNQDLALWNYENKRMYFGTNNLTRIMIDATGNVGIGTGTPAAQLHTTGTVRLAGVANCASGIQSNANGDLSCIVSSRHFKTVTGALPSQVALANVMALRPQIGTYKATPDVPEHWLIAEEVASVDPALVGLANGKPFTVKTQNVVADLVAVVQHQQRQIDELKQALATSRP